ncbi:MAG: GNAT family N-acetyltransferase [Bacteroidetes bacterium]|nr:GNAT family N-acetyltransferase [Bacteroidota bacterium]
MNEFYISTDPALLDIDMIHHFLSTEAYWCKGIPLHTVQNAIAHSLNFGVYYQQQQVGYARVISDYSTIAYLGDVFILPEFRGKGLSKLLLQEVMQHPQLQGLRRFILLTQDAHELYKQFGWQPITAPDRWMEVHHKNVYL